MNPETIVALTDERKEFVRGPDGLLYWWPGCEGAISASELRVLANELDRRNSNHDSGIPESEKCAAPLVTVSCQKPAGHEGEHCMGPISWKA